MTEASKEAFGGSLMTLGLGGLTGFDLPQQPQATYEAKLEAIQKRKGRITKRLTEFNPLNNLKRLDGSDMPTFITYSDVPSDIRHIIDGCKSTFTDNSRTNSDVLAIANLLDAIMEYELMEGLEGRSNIVQLLDDVTDGQEEFVVNLYNEEFLLSNFLRRKGKEKIFPISYKKKELYITAALYSAAAFIQKMRKSIVIADPTQAEIERPYRLLDLISGTMEGRHITHHDFVECVEMAAEAVKLYEVASHQESIGFYQEGIEVYQRELDRIKKEAEANRSLISEKQKMAVEVRWKKRKEKMQTAHPEIDKFIGLGMKHDKMAEKLLSNEYGDIFKFFDTTGGRTEEISKKSWMKECIVPRLTELGRTDLITGLNKKS